MKRRHRQRCLALGWAAGLFLAPAWAGAADAANESARPEPPFALPVVEAAPDGRMVMVRRVAFAGNSVVATGVLDAIAAPYLARPCRLDELEELRQTLTRHYVELGYVNSGLQWNGEIVDGVLNFEVVEGRLAAINLSGLDGLDPRYVTRRLSGKPEVSAEVLNIDVLRERFQLLLGDPLFERMNARLLPGTQPGEAILDIDVLRARPYQFTAFANNYRPPSIGANAVGVAALLRNLTGLGDVFEATLQNAPEASAGGRGSVAWQLPLGFSGTRLSLALEHGASSVVEQPAAALDIRSTLSSVDLGISHPLFESLQQRFALGLNRVSRENRSRLLGAPFSFIPNEPDGVTRETLWRFAQDYSYRTPTQAVSLRSTFTSGRNNLQEIAGLPAIDSPAKSFRLWLGQAQWVRQVLDNGAQLVVRATVQRSPDRLLALDGLAVGGVNTVRGYRENQLVRDQGAYFNFEFDYPLLRDAATGISLNLIPFIDRGRAKNLGGPGTTLASAGLAARLQWNGFNIDAVRAKRINPPPLASGTESTLQDKGIHLQVSYRF